MRLLQRRGNEGEAECGDLFRIANDGMRCGENNKAKDEEGTAGKEQRRLRSSADRRSCTARAEEEWARGADRLCPVHFVEEAFFLIVSKERHL